MNNKNFFTKIGLMGMAICWIGLSFTSAVNLKLNIAIEDVLSDAILLENITPIHFADNWNDFGGLFYFANGSGTDTEAISESVSINGGETFECKQQVRGFYYNAERWERLWPLDPKTKNNWGMSDLTFNGWLYTRCAQEWYETALNDCVEKANNNLEDYNVCVERVKSQYKADEYGYYGSINQGYKEQNLVLVAWVDYVWNGLWDNQFIPISSNKKLSPTFIRFGNKYPVGFVYDYNGGIGFVWCRISPNTMGNSIKWDSVRNVVSQIRYDPKLVDLFAYSGTDGIRYVWNSLGSDYVDCSEVMWVEDTLIWLVVEWIVWMSSEKNDFGVIGNQTDEKMQYFSSANINNATLMNYARQKAEIMCRWRWNKGESNGVICVSNEGDNSVVDASNIRNKTLIVKGRSVMVKPFDSATTWYYDIFVDDGNLLIDETSASQYVFTTEWFRSDKDISEFNTEVENAMSGGNAYMWDYAGIWSFMKGNFIINWKVKANGSDTLSNKYFIYWKFTTQDSFSDLLEVFGWRCTNWQASDENYCPWSVRWWKNPYANASLIVIDQNYDSPLFTTD